MLTTRADYIVNFCYVVTLIAPVVSLFGVRLVRRGNYLAHKRLQIALLTLCILAVFALEARIRMAGGSGSLLRGSPHAGSSLMRISAKVHIFGAIITYIAWIWLLIVSCRAFNKTLPGTFSKRHKQIGWAVIGGLIFTALSATVVYFLAFVD
jgi:putative membrane protein